MSKTVRVNVTTLANAKAVRREKRNGRDVLIVPSATLPDNVVMNGILYPADEIKTSFKSLERTPAPLGHPMVNGKFVSASDPEGINIGHIGAWNENVRQEGGRVLLDKVIDVEVANRSEGGKAVIAAIEAGGPVHTSTGLLCVLEAANAADHKHIARSIRFDHDAILLNEAGAATPEKGVGMLVNSSGQPEEVEVINSALADMAEQEIDYAGSRLVEAFQRREQAGIWDQVKSAIMDALGGAKREPKTNNQENDMSNVSKEQFDALSAKVDSLADALKPDALATAIGNAVTAAVKPMTDAHNTLVANQKAKDDAELEELRGKIVKANLMDEPAAKELTLNAARALAKNAKPQGAAPLNPAFAGNSNQGNGFKAPKAETK
ncbi:hypothetical protein GCM10011390_41770 [Aureimonas endophytica]|uniref:Uncharacterized protein n=1 Tax=Aureimonas endophytica TaxID=2027858 RepID=A0A916ZYW1_9HYPH|nr:hypothetical protein [Aureimonas endophytica]GGE18265.1 hypothetical protein GCM10011390_41770 [Aureimonas endophytica]